ncbi:MAG: cation diffusion facilitator family transporter [Rhodobacteraceae bacterium]|nr:cation diffusion facilitator family transporter [Paracoccaceae bacterium]
MRWATRAALGSALLLITAKAIAYAMTNSVSILSSLADSALDLMASTVNFIAVRHSLMPADDAHTFGHGKAEPLSALAQSAFVAGAAVLLLVESISRFDSAQPLERGQVGIAVMVFSMVVTFVLVTFQRYVVRATNSTAIGADALHYTGDILMNLSVIVALVLSTNYGIPWADPVFGIGIAAYLVWNAWRIAQQAIGDLMDKELPQEDREKIDALARLHPKVKNVHELRTRKSGIYTFIQFHLVLDKSLSLLEAHRIADDVEKSVIAEFPGADVIIHEDPEGVAEFHRPVGADF